MKDDVYSLLRGVWLRGPRGCNAACVLFTRTCARGGATYDWREESIFLISTETLYD